MARPRPELSTQSASAPQPGVQRPVASSHIEPRWQATPAQGAEIHSWFWLQVLRAGQSLCWRQATQRPLKQTGVPGWPWQSMSPRQPSRSTQAKLSGSQDNPAGHGVPGPQSPQRASASMQ